MPKKVDVTDALDARGHPFRNQIDEIRILTKSLDPDIIEEWKWNAPSFRLRDEYLFTFMLRPDDYLHVVVHHTAAPEVMSPLLEGDYADGRRMIYLRSEDDLATHRGELERVLRELVERTP